MTQLKSLSPKCETWRLVAQERDHDVIDLLALLNTSKDKYNLREGQIAVVQKQSQSVVFEGDACNEKVSRLFA